MLDELRRRYRLVATGLTLVLLAIASLLLVSGVGAASTLTDTTKPDGPFATAYWQNGQASQNVYLFTSAGAGGPTTNLTISMSSHDASGWHSFSQHGTIPNTAVTLTASPSAEMEITLNVDTSQLPASSFDNGGGPTGMVSVTWSANGATPYASGASSEAVAGSATGSVYGTPLGLPSGRSITIFGINQQ